MRQTQLPGFYEPRESASAQWLADWLCLPALRGWHRIVALECPTADRERLAEATAGAAIVMPNHPTLAEPLVVYRLLREVGCAPRFAMSWHVMADLPPFLRWLARGVGGFSIRRTVPDRPAFALSRQTLAAGRALLMFPEGETYGVNDRLLPYHQGVAQIGFWGWQDLQEAVPETSIKLVPVAVKYLYDRPLAETVDAALAGLEEQLGLGHEPLDRYQRLRRVGLGCLAVLRKEYGANEQSEAPLGEQIQEIYDLVLARLAGALGVKPSARTYQDQLHRLYAVVHEQLYQRGESGSAYEKSVQAQREPAWQTFEQDLARLQTFQAVSDGYVREHPSGERYLDVIGRLEREVLGRPVTRLPRRAVVRVGEPVDLSDFGEAYGEDRRATVEAVTAEVRARTAAMLAELSRQAPVVDEAA